VNTSLPVAATGMYRIYLVGKRQLFLIKWYRSSESRLRIFHTRHCPRIVPTGDNIRNTTRWSRRWLEQSELGRWCTGTISYGWVFGCRR
jgi:hypothetical protein